MRTSIGLWWVVCAFFGSSGTLYLVWNIIANPNLPLVNRIEWAGNIALYFVAIMAAFIAFYLMRVSKAQGGVLPEDVLSADIDDGEPEVGEFSPWSWWPIVLAGAGAFAAVGFAVGTWLIPVALGIFAVAIVGWVFEYYRGHFAR